MNVINESGRMKMQALCMVDDQIERYFFADLKCVACHFLFPLYLGIMSLLLMLDRGINTGI